MPSVSTKATYGRRLLIHGGHDATIKDDAMFNRIVCCSALLAIVAAGLFSAAPSATRAQSIHHHSINVQESALTADDSWGSASPSSQALIAAIESWISFQFDLPTIHEHPRVEIASTRKIATLRSYGFVAEAAENIAPNDSGSRATQHDILAVYDDATRTIYLREGWTGSSPVELSVLVHEMVHHFQNLLGLKHACPQEREKLAYLAQDRWLGLFGHSLANDFELDPFSLLVKTKCMY
jgi:hypothetical protein